MILTTIDVIVVKMYCFVMFDKFISPFCFFLVLSSFVLADSRLLLALSFASLQSAPHNLSSRSRIEKAERNKLRVGSQLRKSIEYIAKRSHIATMADIIDIAPVKRPVICS